MKKGPDCAIQNISTRLKTAKTALKNNYLKNCFYENKKE